MRADRLTSKLQSALADAQSLAVGKDHSQLEPLHLLIALLEQQGGAVKPLLMQVGFDLGVLTKGLSDLLDKLPVVNNPTGDIQPSPALVRVFNLADKKTQQSGDQYIASETVLSVLMDDNGSLGTLLTSQGVSKQALENAIKNLRGGQQLMTLMPKMPVTR